MSENSASRVTAEVVDVATLCTLEELCLACDVEANWITELIAHGAIDPIGIDPIGQGQSDWRFTSLTIVRVAKAKRLERDLELNFPGVALALELIDEIDTLRVQLNSIGGPATNERQ